MRKRAKSLLTFLLVLVLTVVIVSALSVATSAKTRDRVSASALPQRTAAQELTASIPEEGLPMGVSLLAFGSILTIPAAGGIRLAKVRRRKAVAGSAKKTGITKRV